jgi:hypothetical protein
MTAHQYVERQSLSVVNEEFCGDPIVSFLYSSVREKSGWLFKALTSAHLTNLLGMLHFDIRPVDPDRMRRRLARGGFRPTRKWRLQGRSTPWRSASCGPLSRCAYRMWRGGWRCSGRRARFF